jgi:flagellar motility protein MotE (MotC chaperone)
MSARPGTPPLDHDTLRALRERHPAWRLLASPHAALIASFLHRVFVAPNRRVISEPDLVEALEDQLYALQEIDRSVTYPKPARDYLNDWAAPDKGWLRKFYRTGTDEAQFDLTPATEKAIAWLASLTERSFVGTESRLLTLFSLLEQIAAGTEVDPARRLDDLRRKREAIDAEIARVESGDVLLLDDTAVRDRFQQFQQLARELLADFREVEHNFRQLDRKVREKIALWDGGKGALLDEIMGERDAIGDSDQGRSFRAFWDFLMSSRRQEELSTRLDQVLALPAVSALAPDPRTRRVHHDWLAAGEHTQRTVAQLSQQLRRFLDDRAWLDNRRIIELLHGVESKAMALRAAMPGGIVMHVDAMGAEPELPLERPLFTPGTKTALARVALAIGADDLDTSRLFDQIVVDKARLRAQLSLALRRQPQISLRELLERAPLQQGLAELIAYLELAHADSDGNDRDGLRAVIDEHVRDTVSWRAEDATGNPIMREAHLPRVVYTR